MTEYRLNTDPVNRAQVIQNLLGTIDDLPIEKAWTVTVEAADETRRVIQNRLVHRWCRAWELHNGESPGWGFGQSKLDWLLPLKLSSNSKKVQRQAMEEAHILSFVPDREIKVKAAFGVIRSKDIPVKLFAEWLTQYRHIASVEGCILTSSEDLMNQALMRSV